MTPREKLEFRLRRIEEAAQQATPGNWHRNHGVITSKVPGEHDLNKFEGHVVALTDISDIKNVGLMGHDADIKRAFANGRYLEAANPKVMLSLIELIREILPLENS